MSTKLWKKQSNHTNALYVDLFPSKDKEFLEMTFMLTKFDNVKPSLKKNAADSLARRKAGNQLFVEGQFHKAIELYNESLCLAPPNSEYVGLAYANRSVCFLKLKMYNECLVDIKLARQDNYPKDLAFKLDEREAECLIHIENDGNKSCDIGSKLSYDPDETFPCVANVLNVEVDGNGNFTATAKQDIGVGKTVAVETAFVTYLLMGRNSKCNICLRNTNLVPCNGCADAMFCYEKCKNNTLHDGECGLEFSGIGDLDAGVLKEVRIILMVIDMFHDADELMDFVWQTLKHNSMDSPTTDVYQSRYRDFLNLPFSRASPNSEQFVTTLYFIYKLALESPKVKKYFNSEKHRRFLMHLLGFHFQITDSNSNWSKRLFEIDGQVKNVCTHGLIGLRNKFFNLSCAPNVMHSDHNDLSVYITIRPVKKGEELLTYIADYLLLEPKASRQKAYREQRKSTCKCSRCEGVSATSKQQQEIISDPDYSIVSSRHHEGDLKAMEEKYANFLNKYGHIPWCDAIGKVIDSYVCFLRDKLSGVAFSSDMIEAIKQL